MCHDVVRPNAMSSTSFTTDSTFIKTNTLSWTTALWDCCNHTVNLQPLACSSFLYLVVKISWDYLIQTEGIFSHKGLFHFTYKTPPQKINKLHNKSRFFSRSFTKLSLLSSKCNNWLYL